MITTTTPISNFEDFILVILYIKYIFVFTRACRLIPNLVSTVKGAANFEQSTLTAVTTARAQATSVRIDANSLTPANLAQYENAQTGLSGALGKLLAIAEAYPALTATENFRGLQVQLEGTENRIAVSRRVEWLLVG